MREKIDVGEISVRDNFSGVLKDINLDTINEELVNILVERKIYTPIKLITVKGFNLYDKPSKVSVNKDCLHKKEDSTKLKYQLFFESREYNLNDSILENIYEIIKIFIELFATDNSIIEIEKNKLNSFLTIKSKLKYLSKRYKNLCFDLSNNGHFQTFIKNENNWKEIILDAFSKEFFDLIVKYLKGNYGEGSINYKAFFSDIDNKFLNSWIDLYKNREVLEFYNEQMSLLNEKLDKDNQNKKNKNYGLENTIQKILLFQKIINYKNWSELSVNMKGKILSPIIGVHKDTIIKAIDIIDPTKELSTKSDFHKDVSAVKEYINEIRWNNR